MSETTHNTWKCKQEINGQITYDREKMKFSKEMIRDINLGLIEEIQK